MKKALIIIGIILLVVIWIGSTAPKKTTEKVGTVQTPQPTIVLREYTVGDIIKLNDREIVINSVRRANELGYSKPNAGKEYVIVNVTIRNTGKDDVEYHPFDFKIQDINGAVESETFAPIDDNLRDGKLISGGSVTGSIPYETFDGKPAKLIYKPSMWKSDRVINNL